MTGVLLALGPVTAASAQPAEPSLLCELLPALCPPPEPTPTPSPTTPSAEPTAAPAAPVPSPTSTTDLASPSSTPLAQAGGTTATPGTVAQASDTVADAPKDSLPSSAETNRPLADELAGEDGALRHPLAQASPVEAVAASDAESPSILGWGAALFAGLAVGAIGLRAATTGRPQRGRHLAS